jgi:outer membrane protein assembly factor BamB
MNNSSHTRWVPVLAAAVALALGAAWWWRSAGAAVSLRVPGTDRTGAAGTEVDSGNPVLRGTVTRGAGRPATWGGSWPQFRGEHRDGLVRDGAKLAREWEGGLPRRLWSVEAGEGYAGVAVMEGRVYLMDYDRARQQDALRCLSLEDGAEIWRLSYPVPVKRNHGMSRTVPSVTNGLVVAMGPKCHVVCADAATGELKWGLDLVRDYGATVPPWYTGQCPLIDRGVVVLAPGGADALVMGVDAKEGKVLWRSPNPRAWKMTHVSPVPMDFAGRHFYVYCGHGGVAGVEAETGALLWETTDWKISIATVPSPVVVSGGRIFLSGGYNAGSLMLQLKEEGGAIKPVTRFRLKPEVFGATQQTPVFFGDHLYGIRPDGELVCLDLEGKVTWSSGSGQRFDLGPFLVADDLILALSGSGRLALLESNPAATRVLASNQVLQGHEAWAPLALVDGRLLARDLTQLVCLDLVRR